MLIGKIVWGLSLVMQIIIRYPYQDRRKQDQTSNQEKILLLLLTIGAMLIPLIYIFTNWLSFADYFASIWLIGLGIFVTSLGLYLFWRAHTDLGRNWTSTLAIHEDHELVTNGVYHYIRHPMYTANFLLMLAQVFLFPNWIAGFSGLVVFALMYVLRVDQEEQMMLETFGEQYQDYMLKTGRILPKLGSNKRTLSE